MPDYRVLENYLSRLGRNELDYNKNAPLDRCCTFRIGGPADYTAYPKTTEALIGILDLVSAERIPVAVLGNGSNILFDDTGFRGIVVFTSGLKEIRCSGSYITCESGASLAKLCEIARQNSLSGLEFAFGIPGTCGGAIYMNAGAFGGEMSQIVVRSTCYCPSTGMILTLEDDQHSFGYRCSFFTGKEHIILRAELHMVYDDSEAIQRRMEANIKARAEKQPLEYPSAGSVFKRCPGHFIAQLIDNAGLKGRSVGAAQVSEKHAGFIINRGGATSGDVINLITEIRNELYRLHSLDIECEIKYLLPEGGYGRL